MRSHTWLILTTLSLHLLPASMYGGSKQEEACSKVISLGGKVTKDEAGNVIRVNLQSKTRFLLSSFTDDDITSIDFSAFSHLEAIDIHYWDSPRRISDRSLLHLLTTPGQLLSISIVNGRFSDDALSKFIKQQTTLMVGDFHGTSVSDKTCRDLAMLKDLRVLILAGTNITDEGLKELAKMDLLISLDVSRTAVSDAGLAAIQNMAGLIGLTLTKTKVTDAGIQSLRSLKALRRLGIGSTNITEEGKQTLKAALPGIEFQK